MIAFSIAFFINEYEKGRYEITDDANRCYGIFGSKEKADKRLDELKKRYYWRWVKINKNNYYYLNNTEFNEDILNEYFGEQISEDIETKQYYVLDELKDYLDYAEIWSIPNDYITSWSFDKVDYEKYHYKLWNTYCITDYFFKNLKLDSIEFSDGFYKDFGLKDNWETDEKLEKLFKHLFKNIDLLFRYRVYSYEKKLNKFYDFLNLKYLGYTDENLNEFYLKLTRSINLRLNYRGYGILYDNIWENQLDYCKESYYYNPQYYQTDIIKELGFLAIWIFKRGALKSEKIYYS